MEFEPMKAVYCYFFPEVRSIIRQVQDSIPDEFFINSTPVGEVSLGNLFEPGLAISKTNQGTVNLDEIHVPILERMIAAYELTVTGLQGFSNVYPTSGSSEGIREIIKQVQMRGFENIYVFKGEYEGYKAYAEIYGMNIQEIDRDVDLSTLAKGFWFISNPSAIDGNIINNEKIHEICDLGHKVMIDLAYVGSTVEHNFDIEHENIDYAVVSLSKPYGLFRFRIGYTFSRQPIDSLYGNKWFKDVTRMMQGLKVIEDLPVGILHTTYERKQREIIDGLNDNFGLGIRQSDVMLLGHLNDISHLTSEQSVMVAPFQRGDSYRFCLTPYFERLA